jgi:hypothetical protein
LKKRDQVSKEYGEDEDEKDTAGGIADCEHYRKQQDRKQDVCRAAIRERHAVHWLPGERRSPL